jgi:hypothetical protein
MVIDFAAERRADDLRGRKPKRTRREGDAPRLEQELVLML